MFYISPCRGAVKMKTFYSDSWLLTSSGSLRPSPLRSRRDIKGNAPCLVCSTPPVVPLAKGDKKRPAAVSVSLKGWPLQRELNVDSFEPHFIERQKDHHSETKTHNGAHAHDDVDEAGEVLG